MSGTKVIPPADQPKCPQCGTPLPTGALAGLCPACLLKMGVAADTVTEGKQPPFTPPPVAELAPLFPQLEILELIGKGGMGAVYKARQKQLDRIVALKILPPGIGNDSAFAERFTREAQALAKLNHPGIVTLYEFGVTSSHQPSTLNPQLFYFLMEFVDGVNLRQLLHAGRVSAREALAIVPQICDALQFAHDQGIVHRDIKPENILMDRRGRVKVADFGLAKIVEGGAGSPPPATGSQTGDGAHGVSRPASELTDAGKAMGTPQYMSPEQCENPGEVDHRADIYALGVVFYQMLTGELPGKKIEPPSRKVQIDVRLDEVVLRALERKPELRYQQASVLKTQVETISADAGKSEIPQSLLPATALTAKKIPWQVWVVVGLLGLEGIGNLLAIPQQPQALVWVLAKILFITGLLRRWRPVYVLVLLVQAIHIFYFAPIAAVAALLNLILLVLLCMVFRHYFPPQTEATKESQSLLTSAATERGGLTASQIFIRTVVVAALVWLGVVAVASSATSLLPRVYVGTARVKLASGPNQSYDPYALQNQFALIQSPQFLKQVGEKAEVRKLWKDILVGDNAAQEEQIAVRLRNGLNLRPVRRTEIIEISFYDSSNNCVPIANWIAALYCEQTGATMLDYAIGHPSPVRPRPELNLLIGGLGGGFLAIIAGGFTALYLRHRNRRALGNSPALLKRSEATERYGQLALGLFLAGTLGTLFLMTLSPRHELALLFGGVALLMAFVFGLMGWGERFGKFVVLTLGGVLGLAALSGVAYFGLWMPSRERQVRSEMERAIAAEKAALADAVKKTTAQKLDQQSSEVSAPTKTILPTRETNQLVGTTTDTRTVGVWSESTVLPGETLRTIVRRLDGEMAGARAWSSTMVQGDSVRTSSSFSWFFEEKDGFGAIEAEIATREIRDRFTKRPLTLKAFTPLELFCVTNAQGGTLAGYIEFQMFSPAPPDETGKVKVSVQIQHVMSAGLPMIGYSANVPEGYMLRATASEGQASTQTPGGPYGFNSSWHRSFRPGRPIIYPVEVTWHLPLKIESAGGQADSEKLPVENLRTNRITPESGMPARTLPQRSLRITAGSEFNPVESQRTNISAPSATPVIPAFPSRPRIPGQLEFEPFDVVLGKPKLIFSVTNSPGDVYQGFLELIGPTNVIAGLSVDNVKPSVPPVVVKTIPESGAAEVDPGLTELRVTFSQPMKTGGWSWVKDRNETFPEVTGETRFLPDGQTCVLPVKLQPGKLYTLWLNHESAHNFQDVQKQAALPYLLIFQTRK